MNLFAFPLKIIQESFVISPSETIQEQGCDGDYSRSRRTDEGVHVRDWTFAKEVTAEPLQKHNWRCYIVVGNGYSHEVRNDYADENQVKVSNELDIL